MAVHLKAPFSARRQDMARSTGEVGPEVVSDGILLSESSLCAGLTTDETLGGQLDLQVSVPSIS